MLSAQKYRQQGASPIIHGRTTLVMRCNGQISANDGVMAFDKTQLRPFVSFTHTDTYGIPYILKLLENTDIQNIDFSLPKFEGALRSANEADFCHIKQYCSAPEFNESLLTDTKYDRVIDAIMSFMLLWDDDSFARFKISCNVYTNNYGGGVESNEKNLNRMCSALVDFRRQDNGMYVFDFRGVPVIKTAVKILKSYFVEPSPNRQHFNWAAYINHSFYKHAKDVYQWLLDDAMTPERIALLESDMPLPYTLPNIDVANIHRQTVCTQQNYKNQQQQQFKFITGQACCGKTTILERLRNLGWKHFSRGDLGSFTNKRFDPVAVGTLHASLHYMLRQSDVLGDRGFIDNILWAFIMSACDPSHAKTLVHDIFQFFNTNFVEPAICEFVSQKGVIFIDPFIRENQQRQLRRSESGDSWRARLKTYPSTQFMAYYIAARLFGWKVVCVPYTNERTIDNKKVEHNIARIIDYFGAPKLSQVPHIKFPKPPANSTTPIDNSFPKSVGIYK